MVGERHVPEPELDGQSVRLEVPARPGYVLLARLALSAVCRLTPLGDDEVADLKLAITEAASIFVGEADEATGPLQPVPDPEEEETLRFYFQLEGENLSVEIACAGGPCMPEDEHELSWAIIEATVDDCRSDATSIRLVKQLRAAAG